MNPPKMVVNRPVDFRGIEPLLEISGLVDKLLQFHFEIKQAAPEKIITSLVFSNDPLSQVESGGLIANLLELGIDAPFIRMALLRLCAIEIDEVKDKAVEIERFANAINDGKVDFLAMQRALLQRDKYFYLLRNEIGIDYELIFSLSSNVFRPIFEATLEGCKISIEELKWSRNYCPACGALPCMARLEKDTGKRKLWCSVCNSEWTYKRVQCPFCQNDEKETLDYFFLDDDAPYRVDVCQVCKGYIKTIDEKKSEFGKLVFLVEDIKTAYLDLMAEKEGFNKIIQGE